jgi:hypothetical protein
MLLLIIFNQYAISLIIYRFLFISKLKLEGGFSGIKHLRSARNKYNSLYRQLFHKMEDVKNRTLYLRNCRRGVSVQIIMTLLGLPAAPSQRRGARLRHPMPRRFIPSGDDRQSVNESR